MLRRHFEEWIEFKSIDVCAIFIHVVVIFILAVSAANAESFHSPSFLSEDKCAQLDVDEDRDLISVTALCGPDQNNYFFKIWQGNQPLFVAFGEYDSKESLSSDEKKFEGFELNKINFKQKTFRVKFQSADVLPQIVIYDPLLVSDFRKIIQSKKLLEVFISDGNYYSKGAYNVSISDMKAATFLENFNLPEADNNKPLIQAFSKSYLNIPDPKELFEYCYPSLDTFNELNFLEKFGHYSSNESCTATILKNPNAFLDSKIFGISNEADYSLEKLIWAGLLYLDGRIIKEKFLEILSKSSQSHKNHFVNFSAVYGLAFASNKGEAIKNLISVFRKSVIDDQAVYYNLLLHLNCSSYKKSYIEEGKQRVKNFEHTASKSEIANGRILFTLTRNEFFKGIGYVDGELGIIGKNDFDYCVNTVTLANKVSDNAVGTENKLQEMIKVFGVHAFSKALGKGPAPDFTEFDPDKETKFKSADIFDIYQISLEAINHSLQGEAVRAVEKWQHYLNLKYGQAATFSDYAPAEISVSLALFSMLTSEDFHRSADMKVVVDLVRKYFLRDYYDSKFELTYLQQFESIETKQKFKDQMIALLSEFEEDNEVTETLFLLLQRRFVTPESASITRRYRPSGSANLSPELVKLLEKRRIIIDKFYTELAKRENGHTDEVKFLEYLQLMARKSTAEFFPDGTVEEQLLKRNSLVLPKEAQKKAGILDLMMFSTASQGWQALEATSTEATNLRQSKRENIGFSYQPTEAVRLYSELRDLDEKIYELESGFRDIFYNGPISPNKLQETLAWNEVVIFASQVPGLNTLLTFYVTREQIRFVKHSLDEKLKVCITAFKTHLHSAKLSGISCQQSLASIFVPKKYIYFPRNAHLTYILNGAIENFPVGAVSLHYRDRVEVQKPTNCIVFFTRDLSESRNVCSNKPAVVRGMNLPQKSSPSPDNLDQQEFVGEKYSIKYNVALSQVVSKTEIAKLTSRGKAGFWGIGISDFTFSEKQFIPQGFEELTGLSKLPQANEEINSIANLFPDKDVELLLGSEATKNNILNLMKKPRPRILSFATHSIEISNENENTIALVLSPKNDNASNMVLTPDEIVDSGLAGDIVLLSACKTNFRSGAFSSWKNSLVSSFLLNGARSVLASDWLVDDEATKTLMVNVAVELQKNNNISLSRALQLAVRKMRKTRHHHPYFWASFRVIGE